MEKKRKTKKLQKTQIKPTAQSKSDKVAWYALMGFDKTNEDNVGFLGLNREEQLNKRCLKAYAIVHDISAALKFPSENIDGKDNFGTPEQWLNFFKTEHELSDWSFHLTKIKSPNQK